MRVVIALASSSGQLSGVQRHAISLAHCLLERDEISAVHLVAAPWQRALIEDAAPKGDARLKIHFASIGNNAVSRNLWFFSRLPRMAEELEADIVHLAYPVPVRNEAFHCPAVVTLHDLYPYDIPSNFGFPKVLFNRGVLRQCLQRVDAIVCVSQGTYSRLERLDPKAAKSKAAVIPNAVESSSLALSVDAVPEWGQHPFLLCVAQHRRNKNILLALQVFEHLLRSRKIMPQTRLIVLGIEGPETRFIREFIASFRLEENVLLMNGISETLLQWCYRHCSLLLAPSSIEGFGLPVAEALLAGCRIVCSDIQAFRELGGSRVHYVSLGRLEVEAFSDAVCLALSEASPGPAALPELSAPAVARKTTQLYRSLLSAPNSGRVQDPGFSREESGELR